MSDITQRERELMERLADLRRQLERLDAKEYPAASSLALLAGGQTIAAVETFTNGIKLGAGTDALTTYDTDPWSPVLADAATAGNVSATAGTGNYVRAGALVLLTCAFSNISTVGLTAGNSVFIRGLPFTAANVSGNQAWVAPRLQMITFTGYVAAFINLNTSVIELHKITSGANTTNVIVSDLTSGTADISLSISYIAA